jgi:hypothetical protein
MSEEALHRSIVHYLRATLPHGWIVQHTANRPRSKVAGGIEKSLGAVKGWPDIAIYGNESGGTPYATAFFMEVKTAKGRLSPEQREVHDRLKDIGFDVAVVRSIDDVRAVVGKWGLPSRDTWISLGEAVEQVLDKAAR